MFVPNIFTICLLCFQLIQCLTPTGLKVLAAIQTQRVKALANALNLRAKAQYNTALARSRTSNTGLLDLDRFIRDSPSYVPLDEEHLAEFGDAPEQFTLGVPQNEGMVSPENGDNLQSPQQSYYQSEYRCSSQDYGNGMPQLSVKLYGDNVDGGVPDYAQGNVMTSEGNSAIPPNYGEPSYARLASSHLHPHNRLITHTVSHFHGVQPIQPTTQFVTPGVNVHVNQNQNAVVTPHQFPAAIIQPGFNAGGGFGVNTGHGGFINQGSGMTQSQSQSIHTGLSGGGHMIPVHVGGGSFAQTQTQTQTMQQRLRDSGPPGMNDPLLEEDTVWNKLGTYHMDTPEFDKYSDLSGPQNLQPVVKYLEQEQQHIMAALPSMDENAVHPLYRDSGSFRSNTEDRFQELENTGWSGVGFRGRNSGNDRVGPTFTDDHQVEPMAPLPSNFPGLDQGAPEAKQGNIKKLLQHIDEIQLRNMDELGRLYNHRQFHDQKDFHNIRHPNISDINAEVHSADVNDSRVETVGNSGPWRMEDDGNFDTLMLPEFDPMIGSLFQVPEKRFSEEYLRLARSLNQTTMAELNKLLAKERELINALKKNAKHDEDLLMIGYIGDSLLNDFEKRLNNSSRKKREIGGQIAPLNRLLTDPRARLDVPKTLENLGAATRTVFENEKAPMYHVRNMVGSAQDAMMAAMKIPTNNILIPSQYEIVNTRGGDEKLGAKTLNGGEGIAETFNKVGSAFRENVLSGQEALNHVGEVANHAKNAVHSGRYATPRMILMQIPHITREPTKKAMIITPRIFNVAEDGENRLGAAAEPNYVKVGNIMDAVGISNPNTKKLELEKIIIEPQDPFVREIFDTARPPRFLQAFQNVLKGIRVENANEQDFVGNALNTLNDVRNTMGVNSLKELLLNMKENMGNQEIKQSFDENLVETSPGQQNSRNSRMAVNQLGPDQDAVGVSLIPQELTYPYMGHVNGPQLFPQIGGVHNSKPPFESQAEAHKRLGHILGAINPVMFERMFNETLENDDNEIDSHPGMFIPPGWHTHGPHEHEDKDNLGTSMAMTKEMLTPFMGQATKRMEEEFFEHQPGVEEEVMYEDFGNSESSESFEQPQWMQIVQTVHNSLDE